MKLAQSAKAKIVNNYSKARIELITLRWERKVSKKLIIVAKNIPQAKRTLGKTMTPPDKMKKKIIIFKISICGRFKPLLNLKTSVRLSIRRWDSATILNAHKSRINHQTITNDCLHNMSQMKTLINFVQWKILTKI